VKDHFWLWGQNAGRHNGGSLESGYKLPGKKTPEPEAGADFFGIDRMLFMEIRGEEAADNGSNEVPMGWVLPLVKKWGN
jgi:hypothetical protein